MSKLHSQNWTQTDKLRSLNWLATSKSHHRRLPKLGITGPSGAGKTTMTEYFGRNTSFLAFQGDELMFKCFSACPEIAMELFGRAPEPGENERDFAYGNLPLTYEKEHALFELTRDYIEQQLVFAFNDPTTDFKSHDILHNAVLSQPKDANGIVMMPKGVAVEMCAFHRAKHLARQTDFVVLIGSDEEQRKRMLAQRPNMQKFIKEGVFDEYISIREIVQKELLEGINPHVHIMNSYDGDISLEQGRQQIITMLNNRGIEL